MMDLVTDETLQQLRKLSRAATPGEWFTDSEDCDTGHGNVMTLSIYSEGLLSYGKPAKLFDALNSDAMLVEHDDDEYGGRLFDRTSYANAEFIVASVNYTRALLAMQSAQQQRGDSNVTERVARALFKSVYGYDLGDDQDWLDRFKQHAAAAIEAISTHEGCTAEKENQS